jgi:hypothetical protein
MNRVTLQQLGEMLCESIAQLSDAQKAALRRRVYEQMTGKPFRSEWTATDEAFLRSCGIKP